MMHDPNFSGPHPEISELIPWYVNGTLGELDRQRVDAHIDACAICRNELSQERQIFKAMAAEPTVEYMPAASFKRLQATLDLEAADGSARTPAAQPVPSAQHARRAAGRRSRRLSPWPYRVAASLAVLVVALGIVSADKWIHFLALGASPEYHTVTTSAPRPPDEVIRAVFSPNITLAELQALLDEAQLRIVAGPTEAGVYSLAANSRRPINSSLALLRRHASIRFAESTRASDAPGAGDPP
jgi:anti-sigma factor RsiW